MKKKTDMSIRKSRKPHEKSFLDYLEPDYILFSNDAIMGQDGTVSVLRLIDTFTPFTLPITPHKFFVVTALRRNRDVAIEEFNAVELRYDIVLVNPAGEEFVLSVCSVPKLSEEATWTVCRNVLDLSYQVSFQSNGDYIFKALGYLGDGEKVELMQSPIFIQQATDVSGKYKWESKTGQEIESGIVELNQGVISGEGESIKFNGRYVISNTDVVRAEVFAGLKTDSLLTEILVGKGPAKNGRIDLLVHNKKNPEEKHPVVLQKIPVPKAKKIAHADKK